MSDLAVMIYLKEFCCFSIFSSGCNRPNPSTLLDHKYRKIIILYTNLEIKFFCYYFVLDLSRKTEGWAL